VGGDDWLAYSSNDKEWHVYMVGMEWLAGEERTPTAEKGW